MQEVWFSLFSLHKSQSIFSLFLFVLLEAARGGGRETPPRLSTKENKQLQYVYSRVPEGRRGRGYNIAYIYLPLNDSREPESAYYVHMLLSLQAKLEMQIRK